MVHLISDIVDYLLAQVQRGGQGEVSQALPGRPRGAAERATLPEQVDRLGAITPSGAGLTPETVISLISQDMLTEEEIDLYFPMPPVEMPDIVCHRLLVLPESGVQPLVLMIYYNPDSGLKIDQPHYVLDNDIWVENGGRFWSFISVVTGNLDEAVRFVEVFISRLGLSSCFEVSKEGGRLAVIKAKGH